MNKDLKEAKRFGITLGIILITLGIIIPILRKHQPHLRLVYLAAVIFVFSIFFTKVFVYFYKIWLKISHLIGKIVSTVILSIFFYVIFTPVGLVMKCFGRDPLARKWQKDKDSYWVKRDPKLIDPKRLERQF